MVRATKGGIIREFSQKSWDLNNKGWARIENEPTDLQEVTKKRGPKKAITTLIESEENAVNESEG